MGLYEDIKAADAAKESEIRGFKAQIATLTLRFNTLNREYQSALSMIEKLKSEQIASENNHRDELKKANEEIRSLTVALTTTVEELQHEQKSKAAIVANRNYWKRECEAVGMLYKLTDDELRELKQEKTVEKQTLIPVKFNHEQPVLRIAAAIGK